MKTLREETLGKVTLRLVEMTGGYAGIVIGPSSHQPPIHGDNPDAVWQRLYDAAVKGHPTFFGFKGARERFLRIFPEGFETAEYQSRERGYKVAAKAKLDVTVPLEVAQTATGNGEAVLSVFRATNLLSPFEKTRLQEALRGPRADEFVHGAALFALGNIDRGLAAMTAALRPHEIAKWTAVTYLPFLWRPDRHMFLKPEVTKRFANRVGHGFANEYSPELRPPVYESLLNLAAQTNAEVEPLNPTDYVDVQSFIWVVGEYGIEEETAGAGDDES